VDHLAGQRIFHLAVAELAAVLILAEVVEGPAEEVEVLRGIAFVMLFGLDPGLGLRAGVLSGSFRLRE
jgi:hypothetical protein